MNTASIDPWSLLNRNLLFIKDAVRALEAKTSDKFDVYDPYSRELLLECREADLGGVTKLRRLAGGKYDTGSPFNLVASVPGSNQQILRIARKVPFLSIRKPPIEFYNHEDLLILTSKKKFLSIRPTFLFFTSGNTLLLELQMKSILNGYQLIEGENELATISLRWKGDKADYFDGEFKYALSINRDVVENSITRQLLVAFALSFRRVQT